MRDVNAEQAEYWNGEAGETWVQVQEVMDRQLAPLGRLAVEALAPRPGEHVLDIGCGSGQTSFDLADGVAPEGSVVGVDISSPLVELARARAGTRKDVEFVLGDAQQHDFTGAAFDAAFSRFGVMFFDDPIAAFRNICGGMKAGGRLSFVCWRSVDENPSFTLPMQAALPHLPEPPPTPAPGALGPFAFAEAGRVRHILSLAGFDNIVISPHDQIIGVGDAETTRDFMLQVGLLGAALRKNPEATAAVSSAVDAALSEHLTPDGVKLKAAVWVVRAQA